MKKNLLSLTFLLLSSTIFAQHGNVLDFDGSSDYVELDDTPFDFGVGDFTLECWVKTNNGESGFGGLITKRPVATNSAFSLELHSNSIPELYLFPSSGTGVTIQATTAIDDDSWHHVAAVYDNPNVYIYVDGVQEGTGSFSTPSDNDLTVKLGRYYADLDDHYLEGQMDEVRIWNIARTATEIANNMNKDISCSTAGLVACYYFNQGVGGGNNSGLTTLTDGTSNNNDGTLMTFALSGSTSNWINTGIPAPVDLRYFYSQVIDHSVKLFWQTATETNNKGFEVEHSLDNRTWRNIGFMAGVGTTYEKQAYSFLHENPSSGINYYRLKQMDFDGAFEYSNVVSLDLQNLEDFANLRVAPNPVQNGELTLYLHENLSTQNWTDEAENIQVQLFDSAGRLVQKQFFNGQQQTINVTDLLPGIYLLEVQLDGQTFFERVSIQ